MKELQNQVKELRHKLFREHSDKDINGADMNGILKNVQSENSENDKGPSTGAVGGNGRVLSKQNQDVEITTHKTQMEVNKDKSVKIQI